MFFKFILPSNKTCLKMLSNEKYKIIALFCLLFINYSNRFIRFGNQDERRCETSSKRIF